MTKKDLKALVEEEPFKYVSVFASFFGTDWDIISRIVIDPAHEIHNLVKDLLALTMNDGSMEFKPKRLNEEKKIGRFSEYKSNKDATWRISDRMKEILSSLMKDHVFKIPDG